MDEPGAENAEPACDPVSAFGQVDGASGNYIGASSAQSPGAATSRCQVRLNRAQKP